MKENPNTLEARLSGFLELYPVNRGSIWWVKEQVWEEAHPDYKEVRNPSRKGHFGLTAKTLEAVHPGNVPIMHGHSDPYSKTLWYHLPVEGITKEEPRRVTQFDVFHRYPFPWRSFFSAEVSANLDKRTLSSDEVRALDQIERRIGKQMRRNYEKALEVYRKNPAWKRCFKIDF